MIVKSPKKAGLAAIKPLARSAVKKTLLGTGKLSAPVIWLIMLVFDFLWGIFARAVKEEQTARRDAAVLKQTRGKALVKTLQAREPGHIADAVRELYRVRRNKPSS